MYLLFLHVDKKKKRDATQQALEVPQQALEVPVVEKEHNTANNATVTGIDRCFIGNYIATFQRTPPPP